ncbi:MAG: hypothetical protein WA810_02490 [Maribacter sp.]
MRRATLFLGLLVGLYSCDVFYEDSKRLLFTGKVIDEDGAEISNLPVTVYTNGPSVISGSFREDLAEGSTDESGNFALTSLSPEGNNRIDMEINSRFTNGHSPVYASATVIGLEKSDLQDAAYRLMDLRLERIVTSRLTIKRTSNTSDTLFINIQTSPIDKVLYVDSSLQPEDLSFSFFPTDTLLPTENEKSLPLISILAKDTSAVYFKITNTSTAPVGIEKLTLSSNSDSYEFEF